MFKNLNSKQVYKKLLGKRKALEAIDTQAIQRGLMFTKHKYWKKSPRRLTLLTWRVKKKRGYRQIFVLRHPSGSIGTDAKGILSILQDFYSIWEETC